MNFPGDLKTIQELIAQGQVDVKDKDEFGSTAMHLAAEEGHDQIVQYLIDHGVDVNAKDDLDRTPIFYATDRGLRHF